MDIIEKILIYGVGGSLVLFGIFVGIKAIFGF